MANPSQLSDPILNYRFSRDWGAGRFHLRLAAEAEQWLAARRKMRRRRDPAPKGAKLRSWRAST